MRQVSSSDITWCEGPLKSADVLPLPHAAQDKERAAIVKKWLDEAGNQDAPVAELVSAAKFAVALARESGYKQFLQQATMLKNYMQSSDKFAPHFSASL
jgi:hypothetical protein